MATRDEMFAMIKADMDRATATMRQRLERELFRVDPFYAAGPPPKRISRWWRRYRRVQGYLVTLSWALCGEHLHRDSDCNGDY